MRGGACKERKLEVKGFCGHDHGMHGFKEPSYSTRHPSMAAWVAGFCTATIEVGSPNTGRTVLIAVSAPGKPENRNPLKVYIELYGLLSVIINQFSYLRNYKIYRVWKSQRPKPSKPNAATIRRKSSCHPRLFHLNGCDVDS